MQQGSVHLLEWNESMDYLAGQERASMRVSKGWGERKREIEVGR